MALRLSGLSSNSCSGKSMKHLITSITNSGLVTILTSLAMTMINSPVFYADTWGRNWIISWAIVFSYVYVVAPRVARRIND
jgi:hypothetical protein